MHFDKCLAQCLDHTRHYINVSYNFVADEEEDEEEGDDDDDDVSNQVGVRQMWLLIR